MAFLELSSIKNYIKDNFHWLYGDEPAFPFLCPLQVDIQEYLLTCQSLVTHITSNNQHVLQGVSYSHLFGTGPQQLDITNIFVALLRIRKMLLQTDQVPAWEGNSTRPED